MSDYIDLVICEGNNMNDIYRAPAWSHLKHNDKIIVQTGEGKAEKTVDRVYPICTNDKLYDAILYIAGIKLPLKKVISRVIYDDFEYEEA